MTASFPSDGRSFSFRQKQAHTQAQPKASEAAEDLESQGLKGDVQKEDQKVKEKGEWHPLHLRPSNRLGLAQLETNFAAIVPVFQPVNQLPIEPADSQEIKKLTQVIPIMRSLLNRFESRSIVLQPRIDLPRHGSLDLLLRFTQPPNKSTFGIALRSQGNSSITYNEKKEALYIRRYKRKGGLYPWNPNQIDQLGEQEFWLKKNCRDVFGESARDKNRPMIKLLVLTGETKLGKHSEHLYQTVGDQKILLIKKRCSVYVMEENQLIPFLETRTALECVST